MSKGSQQAVGKSEIRIGSVIVYNEPPPPFPSVAAQAEAVADFLFERHKYEVWNIEYDPIDKLRQLEEFRQGNLSILYKQYTVDELRASRPDIAVLYKDADNELLLPVEEQLKLGFLNAIAQKWAIENSQSISWSTWDKVRQQLKIKQGSAKKVIEMQHPKGPLPATLRAEAAARVAVIDFDGEVEKSQIDALTKVILREMFRLSRIALPVQAENPIQLPERVPSWTWQHGLAEICPSWWEIEQQVISNRRYERIAIATHPIADTMRRFLITPGVELEEIRRSPDTNSELQLISRVEPSQPVQTAALQLTSNPEETLSKMTNDLLAMKEEGAALLKIHLDLTDQAYRIGGAQPLLRYDLRDAADRLGYKKIDSRGAYDRGTLREIYRRVLMLQSCLIQAYEIKKSKREKLIGRVPYWKVEAFEELNAGDALDAYQVLLTDNNAPIYTSLVLQPGLWWQTTQMAKYRQYIPSGILRLDTSGKGNEVNRIALKLAASLSIWERINAERHGGSTLNTRVADLLERANIITPGEFKRLGSNAQRVRNYLTEAMEVLRQHGDFNLTVQDLDDYNAMGRGWHDRFLAAKVSLGIRKLEKTQRLQEG